MSGAIPSKILPFLHYWLDCGPSYWSLHNQFGLCGYDALRAVLGVANWSNMETSSALPEYGLLQINVAAQYKIDG